MKNFKRTITHRAGKRFLRTIGNFQARHSLIAATPFLPLETFDWIPHLEQHWRDIREEFERIWQHPEDIPAFHQISPDQARISRGTNWKTYGLMIFGRAVEPNVHDCPRTAAILATIPGLQNAWFSILAPGYHIPPHRGPTRALVRYHLGLRVPNDHASCWIRVDEETRSWREGESMLFDDTYEHEVLNDTGDYRAVLFLDIDRPMDRIGAQFNRAVLRLVQASHYVKDPLRNLAAWNRTLEQRRRDRQ